MENEHHETPLSSATDRVPINELYPNSPRQKSIASDMADYILKLAELNEWAMTFDASKAIALDLWRISVRSGG